MARRKSRKGQLVCQHLERVSREALSTHHGAIRDMVGRRPGVYALYRGDRLYYVGLASNLRSRLKQHLRDRHASTWDRFSVYLTVGDRGIHEIEALLLRIARPRGNKVQGKFVRSQDLRRVLRRAIRNAWKQELDEVVSLRRLDARKTKPPRVEGAAPLARYVKRRVRIRLTHKGYIYSASIRRDGTINYGGRIYRTPSGAAKDIKKRPTSGWASWLYQRAPGDWVPLSEIRR